MIIQESVGKFLDKGKDFKEDDILTIASEGKEVPSQWKDDKGNIIIQKIFLIKTADGKEGNANFNGKTTTHLAREYGNDTIKWVGKKVVVKAMWRDMGKGNIKVYYFFPPGTVWDDETGEWVNTTNNNTVETNEQPPITDEQIKENLEDFDNIQ